MDVFSNSGHGWFGEKDFQIEKVLFLGPLPPGPTAKIFTPVLCENIDEFKIKQAYGKMQASPTLVTIFCSRRSGIILYYPVTSHSLCHSLLVSIVVIIFV